MTSKHSNLYSYLKFALDHASMNSSWVVVVCPPGIIVDECRSLLAGLLPSDAKFGGRTILLNSGAKLSLTSSQDALFVPEGTPFTTLFLGWSTSNRKADAQGVTRWRKAATQNLDMMAQTNMAST
ncbi:hypothetical protein N9917_01530 [Deltaproteobacteria bacterium]|nr:hypothetical protein [Deltaproteobacteria bacterium]